MFQHEPVLLTEVIEGLHIKPDGVYVDCTLGGAGHTEQILKRLTSGGHVYAFDQDEVAIKHAEKKLAQYKGKITLIKRNFQHLKKELQQLGVHRVDGILYDLGVSSPQLDNPERGFSYHHDASLDMRMDHDGQLTAFEVINEWPYERLVSVFFKYGEERFSKQIARKIESAREIRPIQTTGELVELIKEAIPAPARRKGGHPAKRVFQAVRIAVNNELSVFEDSLEQALGLLNPKGRICVITFHSLEDRICKTIFKQASEGPQLPRGIPVIPNEYLPEMNLITRRPITPTKEEVERNKRARSAKLRIIEKREQSQEG